MATLSCRGSVSRMVDQHVASTVSSPFQFVDVFSEQSFAGNPLPVFLDADGMSTEDMQRITRWMNLSETAFLLPPTDAKADYRVRIFTLTHELPFAGHPTLGSCHAWLAAGGQPQRQTEIIQECGIGTVAVRRTDTRLAFAAPDLIRSGPVGDVDLDRIASALQIDRDIIVDSQWVDNGPGWVAVLLDSAQAVLDVEPLREFPTRIDIGIVGPYGEEDDSAFELRAIYSDHQGTMREDPVTGSLNASIAQWLLGSGRATAPYMATQGACVGHNGRIEIKQDRNGTVWVGGATRTLINGDFVARPDLRCL